MNEPLIKRIFELSQGNPGAIRVMSDGYKIFGPTFLDRLEFHKLSGPSVWIVFKDICKQDLFAMMIRIADDAPFGPEVYS